MIIDAHTHIFGKIHGRILEGQTTAGEWGQVLCSGQAIQVFPPYCRETVFSAEALQKYLEIEQIDKAVLLQGCFYGDQNEAVKAAVGRYPDRFAGAMYLEPFAEDAQRVFEENAAYFKAVKLECSAKTGFTSWGMAFNLSDYLWLYEKMAAMNMVLVLDLGVAGTSGYQTDSVKKIMDRCPELKIVICHLGQPRAEYLEDERLMKAWKAQLELANMGRVWFDTASLAAYFSGEIYPYRTGARMFDIALNITGPSRIMAGTDMPGNSLIASYRQMLYLPMLYGKFLELSDMEIAAMMGLNAEKVYFS